MGGGIGLLLAVCLGLVLELIELPERFPTITANSPKLGRLVLLLEEIGLGQNLYHLSYDLPFWWRPIIQPQEVVLVHLDDASHKELGQSYNHDWDRGLYARLLERLTAEGARAVGFDILLSDPSADNPQGDARFARALKANGKVILAAKYDRSLDGQGDTVYRALDLLFDAAAGYGLVNVAQDQDFIVRRHLHVPYEEGSDIHSSLPWQLAHIAGALHAQDPEQRSRERWVNYYGPPGTLPHVSFATALETNDFCPAGCFAGKVVLVGGSVKEHHSGERKDELRTPFTRSQQFVPAVNTQATLTLNLLRGDWLNRPSAAVEVLILLLTGIGFGLGLVLLRPLVAVGVALAGAAGVAVTATALLQYDRLWFPWMLIVGAQIPAALLWSVSFNSVQLYVQNRLFEQSLHMYLPPKLVRKFSSNKDLLKPGAQKQVLTLLFSDIADFTSISEGMDPDELARLMNAYFQAAVGNCIHKTDGTVGKFIGDGIFAFWNAPDQQSDHALRACEAGLRLQELTRREIGGRLLRTRVGLHTGVVNVGNFGSADRVDYTALGENVNLASRLEGLNKFLGTGCLVSAQTKAELGERLVTRALGSFRLKGFESLVAVHELVGWPEQEAETRPWREAFAQALNNYEQRNLEFAELGFRQVLQARPDDGPSLFYLKQIAERAQENLPAETWASYTILKEK